MSVKKSTNRPFSYLLVILLGLAVLAYQAGNTYVQHQIEAVQVANKTKAQPDDDSAPNETQNILTSAQDVFLSVPGVHIDQEFYQIKEIVFGEHKKIIAIYTEKSGFTPFFNTLFRQVISPNAP